MAWSVAQLPRLDGQVAVVTGANSGIGFHTARGLATHGARVVLACRDAAAASRAAGRLRAGGTPVDVDTAELDLSSLDSVRKFGESWDGPLHLLVNNAGVMMPPRLVSSADDFELQFAVNHIGHWVLTGLLLSALAGTGGRVVTVSSIAHHGGTRGVLDANVGETYSPRKTYANSKLANLLFARHLQAQLIERGIPVSSTAAHPGVSATGLVSSRQGLGAKPLVRAIAPVVMRVATQSAAAGARPSLYAAAVAGPGSYSGPQLLGETRGHVGPARLSSLARDDDLAARLWRVSEDLTGLRYEWPTAGDAPAP